MEIGGSSDLLRSTSESRRTPALRIEGAVDHRGRHTGEDEVRHRTLEAIEPFRFDDGSYRLVDELTHVIARKPS